MGGGCVARWRVDGCLLHEGFAGNDLLGVAPLKSMPYFVGVYILGIGEPVIKVLAIVCVAGW